MSDATRGPSKRRAAERARLKDEIDAGRTRDKVPGFDPGAAPLGTDEESAGTPPAPDGDQAVGSSMGRIEQAADPKGNDRSVYECRTGDLADNRRAHLYRCGCRSGCTAPLSVGELGEILTGT